ncbi:CPBP family intramembrane glutamic endopeptidase [Arthrobacter liuii]|uniref:CPBP family intramembrane glutamic endopeptidase n=2 Tax=Arthrobacter liuii TaxID=1476996 RepID=UPI0035E79449
MFLGLAALVSAFTVHAGPDVRVGILLAGVAGVEFGGLLAIRTRGPVNGLRRTAPRYAFLAAGLIAAGYIGATLAGNPMVGAGAGNVSPLKLVAVLAALIAGFFEETLFRGVLMDRLAAAGRSPALQVFISGLVFGGLHFYVFAGFPAALLAQAATTILGWGLAALYLMSKRSLWPCVIAHVLIDAALEPALLQSLIR